MIKPDGRFYQVGNSTRVLMDRNFFAISLSDDGAKFNKMYQLVTELTKQRFQGHLKCDGYQYPSCLVDGDKLLIVSSIDNLLKGASGQAVQNMNIQFGLAEDAGLRLKPVAF